MENVFKLTTVYIFLLFEIRYQYFYISKSKRGANAKIKDCGEIEKNA